MKKYTEKKSGRIAQPHRKSSKEEVQGYIQRRRQFRKPDGDYKWTRGEQQRIRCRDAWAALLFYAQFIGIAVIAFKYGVPAISATPHYIGLVCMTFIAGCTSFCFSAISLFVMSACPHNLIEISLLFSLVCSFLICVVSFSNQNMIGGIFGAVSFLLNCCYAFAVWNRIPFAAANLNTGLTPVKKNAGVMLAAYLITLGSFAYSIMWMTALVGVYDMEGLSTSGDDLSWGYYFLLLLAIFWTQQVLQNTIHAIIAGVVSTWWFNPDDAGSCCSVAIRDSSIRAMTTSFGSICFGSLLVAIIHALRSLIQAARGDRDDRSVAGRFLYCVFDCILSCFEDMLEYFNKFAYIYVGMYGYGYLEAGKNVMALLKQKGWSIIISDNLISNVLSLFCLVIGGLTGCVGLIMNQTNPEWFEGYAQGSEMGIAFGFSFLIGLIVSAILLSVVDSSVNTVLVCFAEAPFEFFNNHQELSSAMRMAWREVYPEECHF